MSQAAARPMDLYPTRTAQPMLTPRQDPVVWSTPGTEGPISAADLEGFDRDGFLTVAELITPDEVNHYRTELRRLTADPSVHDDERSIVEPDSAQIRSIFEVHKLSEVFAALVSDPRVLGRARQILGSDVYVHQSRVNIKPGFGATGFYWHSDFETWHAEDGLPRMRTVSISIALTENFETNGGLMIIPGSHKTFVGCGGETPAEHYRMSLKRQEVGTPSPQALRDLADEHGIRLFTGPAGSATMFDCNCMHGSGDNITPYPRSNVFIVYNSVDNTAVEPFAAPGRRPDFIAARDFTPA